MESYESIQLPTYGPPISPGDQYFAQNVPSPSTSTSSSTLLNRIRNALQGTRREKGKQTHETVKQASDSWYNGEERVSWDEHVVIWSSGGVQRRKWCFKDEGEPVQYACSAHAFSRTGFDSLGIGGASQNSTHQEHLDQALRDDAERETFSPFFKSRQSKTKEGGEERKPKVTAAVYVFLRSFGKILYINGDEHTFSLPFIVRRAWQVNPAGVIMQRVLDEGELEEASLANENALPTLFSFTTPFKEPQAVGLTKGILSSSTPAVYRLREDEEQVSGFESVPAEEHLLTLQGYDSLFLAVTVDVVTHSRLTIWRYCFIKGDDSPANLHKPQTNADSRRFVAGHSKDPISSRGADRIRSPSPDIFEPAQPADLADMPAMAEMVPLANGGSLGATSQQGIFPHKSQHSVGKGRRSSLSRNDLTSTMDRMVLGRRYDPGSTLR